MTTVTLRSTAAQTDMLSLTMPTPVEDNMRDEIVWLEVSFAEKDSAKGFGARWSPRQGKWYAPPYTDLTNLRRWMDKKRIYLTADFGGQVFGARFDRGSSSWFILDDMDSTPFTPWLSSAP